MAKTPLSREAQLQQLINTMPQELTPTRDLWQDIEKRLDKPLSEVQLTQASERKTHYAQWAMAASVLLVALIGYQQLPLFGILGSNGNNADLSPELAKVTQAEPRDAKSNPADSATLAQLLTQIAASHQAQVDALENAPHAQAWQASYIGAPLEQGLTELRLAATQIFQALQANPTDQQLWQLWLWVQRRELELLQQGQKLPLNRTTQGNSI